VNREMMHGKLKFDSDDCINGSTNFIKENWL